MKRQYSFLWATFACLVLFSGCYPSSPTAATQQSVVVKIECRDAPGVRQEVVQLLRSGRARDMTTRTDGSILVITAAFIAADTPPERLGSILQDLKAMTQVINVDVEENHSVVRQNN